MLSYGALEPDERLRQVPAAPPLNVRHAHERAVMGCRALPLVREVPEFARAAARAALPSLTRG